MSIESGSFGGGTTVTSAPAIGAPSGMEGGMAMTNLSAQTGPISTETTSVSVTAVGQVPASVVEIGTPTISAETAAPSFKSLSTILSETAPLHSRGFASFDRSFDAKTAMSLPAMYQKEESVPTLQTPEPLSFFDTSGDWVADSGFDELETADPGVLQGVGEEIGSTVVSEDFETPGLKNEDEMREALIEQIESSVFEYIRQAVSRDTVDESSDQSPVQSVVTEGLLEIATESAGFASSVETVEDITPYDVVLAEQEAEADIAQMAKTIEVAIAAGLFSEEALHITEQIMREKPSIQRLITHLKATQEQLTRPIPETAEARDEGFYADPQLQTEQIVEGEVVTKTDTDIAIPVRESAIDVKTTSDEQQGGKRPQEKQTEVVDERANDHRVEAIVGVAKEAINEKAVEVQDKNQEVVVTGTDLQEGVEYVLGQQNPKDQSEIVRAKQPDHSLPEVVENVSRLGELKNEQEVETAARQITEDLPAVRMGTGKSVDEEDVLRVTTHPAFRRRQVPKTHRLAV